MDVDLLMRELAAGDPTLDELWCVFGFTGVPELRRATFRLLLQQGISDRSLGFASHLFPELREEAQAALLQ